MARGNANGRKARYLDRVEAVRLRAATDHHAEVGAADLRRELAGENMVGGRHRLLREGAQEERLFAPGADLSERARGTDEAVILEFGLFGRGDLKGRGRRRPGLRLAETFERELAVELVDRKSTRLNSSH